MFFIVCLFVFGNIFRTIAIKQLSHLVSPGSNFSILTNLFKCVQNVNKPSVSNWWKQCQRLTRLCSTVKESHSTAPRLQMAPSRFVLVLITILRPIVIYLSVPGLSISLVWKRRQVCSVHQRWRSRVYITDLKKNKYIKVFISFSFKYEYIIIWNITSIVYI